MDLVLLDQATLAINPIHCFLELGPDCDLSNGRLHWPVLRPPAQDQDTASVYRVSGAGVGVVSNTVNHSPPPGKGDGRPGRSWGVEKEVTQVVENDENSGSV